MSYEGKDFGLKKQTGHVCVYDDFCGEIRLCLYMYVCICLYIDTHNIYI
jgi:hypothetical protein